MFNSKSVVRLLLLGLLLLSTTTAIKKYLRLAKTQAASGGDTGGDGGSNDGDGEDGEGDTGGDGENEPEGHDGEGHRGNDRYYALQALFGSDYTSSPGFVQNYIQQVQQRIVAPVTGGSWTSLGPTTSPSPYLNSGRIRKVISHPNSPGTVFVLASQGGLWKTDNFFDTYPTWLPLTNQLVSTNGGSVSLGSNPDTIYLGLGDPFDFIGVGGIVVISTDGGATWSDPINLGDFYATKQPTVVYDIAVDISTGSDIILVATDVGIFQSTDGGASFNNVYDGGISSIEVYNLVNTNIGWLVFDNNQQTFLTSADNGASWTVPAPTDSNWGSLVNNNIYVNKFNATFAVGAAGDAIVYAMVDTNSHNSQIDVFKSTDGGMNWISLNFMDYNTYYRSEDDKTYFPVLVVDSTDVNRNTVYIGNERAAIRSTDGGNTWSVVSMWNNINGNTNTDGESEDEGEDGDIHHYALYTASILSNTAGGSTIVFGTEGGLFISSDNGNTWSAEVNTGLATQLTQYIAGSSNTDQFLVGMQNLGTRERNDGSTSWTLIQGGDGEGCGYSQALNKVKIISAPKNEYSCSFYKYGSFRSFKECTDGIDENENPIYFTNIAVPTAAADPTGTIFFTMTQESVYKSYVSSSELKWRKIGTIGVTTGISATPFRGGLHSIGVSPSSTSEIAVAKDTELSITVDGGVSWTTVDISASIAGWKATASPVWASSTVLYVASEDPTVGKVRLAKSTDGGVSWFEPGSGLPDVPVGKLLVSNLDPSGDTLYAGTWIGMYVTTDGGASWNVMGSVLPYVVINDIYQNAGSIEVATYGRGVYRIASDLTPLHKPILFTDPQPLVSSTSPTTKPTRSPTTKPTKKPTANPTTKKPTTAPSRKPTKTPTNYPSRKPTVTRTLKPSKTPTRSPTSKPIKK